MSDTINCHYDYANKCDCSEDDKCGCTFPNNIPHDFTLECMNTEETEAIVTDKPMTTSAFDKLSSSTSHQEPSHKTPNSPLENKTSTLLGKPAPDFTAPALLEDNTIIEKFNFYQNTQNQNTVLFFYPEDFTFTCPSELLMLNTALNNLTQRNTKVLAISTDSIYSHLTWKELPLHKDGIPDINFPLIADLDKQITISYGALTPKETASRSTFIIDKKHIIRHISFNDTKIRRTPSEIIRIIDILNQQDDMFNTCANGWKQNFQFERPEQQSITEFFSSQQNN